MGWCSSGWHLMWVKDITVNNIHSQGWDWRDEGVIFLCVRIHPNLLWPRHTTASPSTVSAHWRQSTPLTCIMTASFLIFMAVCSPDWWADTDPESIMVLPDKVCLSLYGMEHMHLQQALGSIWSILHMARTEEILHHVRHERKGDNVSPCTFKLVDVKCRKNEVVYTVCQ